MIAYHVDRNGSLTPGQVIEPDYCDNPFNLPYISRWGEFFASILGHTYFPEVITPAALDDLSWYNLELVAENVRKESFPNEHSRMSSFYAAPDLESLSAWASVLKFQPSNKVYAIGFEGDAKCFDAFFLRSVKPDASTTPSELLECLTNIHKYWSGVRSETPLLELLIPLPVKILYEVSFNTHPQAGAVLD